MPNWRVFLPFLLLLLASLACDEGYPDLAQVQAVAADTSSAGTAYARVGTNQGGTLAVYRTEDYGAQWQRYDGQFPTSAQTLAINAVDEALYYNNQLLWTFPRRTFRDFFLGDEAGQVFSIPNWGTVPNSIHADTLYVAMGTEGVLVGPAPSSGSTRPWTLTASGIDTIDPIPLTISDPLDVTGIVVWAFIAPPLTLLHAFILTRLWVYVLPEERAKRTSMYVAVALSALAVAAVIFWLTTPQVDYYDIVGAMTLITVIVGMALTYVLARRQPTLRPLHRGILVACAGVASLLVPAGVAAIWWAWWLIFSIVSGYFFYRRAYGRFFRQREAAGEGEAPSRWLLDRITFETMIALVGISVLSLIFAGTFDSVMWRVGADGLGLFIGFGVFVVLAVVVLNVYARLRIYPYAGISRDVGESVPAGLRREIIVASVLFPLVAGGASFVTFIGQTMAYGWFNSLLIR